MKRLPALALASTFVFATPSLAMEASSAQPALPTYGPLDVPAVKPAPIASRRAPIIAIDAPPIKPAATLIAGTEIETGAMFGLGAFRITEPRRPFSVRRDEAKSSRIAAVGLAVRF